MRKRPIRSLPGVVGRIARRDSSDHYPLNINRAAVPGSK